MSETFEVEQLVTQMCEEFARKTGIEVSPLARDLASVVIRAISEDPHPRWEANGDMLDSLAQAYAMGLPLMLHQVAAGRGIDDRITSFDLLHWFAKNFDTLCIIPKR